MNGMSARPMVVVSDIHLSHGGSFETASALATLIERHPGHEIVLGGDIFNLSCDPIGRDPVESVCAMLEPHAELLGALKSHLAAGAPVTLLAGNHDASTMRPELRPRLLALLGLELSAPFENLSWFIRRGSVHVEHGHVYDPDNAPTHPLFEPRADCEPLGVSLTRRFLAPNRAFDFAHEHEITPLAGLAKAIRIFGLDTPALVARYFKVASQLCWEAAKDRGKSEARREGEARVSAYAEQAGVPESTVRSLLAILPPPTHHDAEDMFFRLYFDRVLAFVSTGTGFGLAGLLRSRSALALGLLGAGYLVGSVRRSANRYGELPVERLREAAQQVRQATGAENVIFGHVHIEDERPGYFNSASFTYHEAPGRPYLIVDEHGRVERRRLAETAS
jgi:hypothetical protein